MGRSHPQTVTAGSQDLAIVAEIALAGTTATAVLGMHPLFLDGSFRVPLLLQVVLAHLTIAAYRRANVSLGAGALLTAVTGAIAITWSQYASTLWVVLPSPDTWTAIQLDVNDAWTVFSDVRAPAPVEPGFIVAASMAIWLASFIADWGAFRTGVSFEALLPSATLFLFAAVLGEEGGSVWSASAFAVAALLFLLVHRTWRQESAASWASLQRRRGRRSLLSSGMALAGVAVITSGIAGPHLPGAADPPVLAWRDVGDGEETRKVVSPLVDVRGRMVNQTNLELFTVKVDNPEDRPTYWRTTSLDEFDGEIFRSSYKTNQASGDLPQSVESDAATRQLTQEISISNLDAIWLPAAYEPLSYDSEHETPVEYDERSSTLIVDKSVESSDDLTYTVTSAVPAWTPDQLRQERGQIPDDIADRYLQLPDDFSSQVAAEAERITAEAETDYGRALALQDYLREFEYTLDPPLEAKSQHSEDALERFLFDIQQGYCEQFAGAFAAMARSLGIPTRVAVGFTMGIKDPNEPTLYRVQGKHAHAWPEVYFDGYGWVPFEPTPSRGLPGGEGWLGVTEAQVDENSDGTSSTTVPGGPGPGGPEEEPSADDPENEMEANPAPRPEPSDKPPSTDQTNDLVPPQLITAGRSVGLGAFAYVLVVPAGLLLQQSIRRRRARRPAEQVNLAWNETVEQAALLGVRTAPAMTVRERAAQLRDTMPQTGPAIDQMANALEHSLYASTTTTEREAAMARTAANSIKSEVARQRPKYRRVFDHLDARRLLPKTTRRRRSAHGTQRTQS